MTVPSRRKVHTVRGRVLHMNIRPQDGSVDLLVRLQVTDLDCRNALHNAMKRGLDICLAYEGGEGDPVYEAEQGGRDDGG